MMMTRPYVALMLPLALAACSGGEQKAEAPATEAAATEEAPLNAAQRAYTEANDRMHSAMASSIPADADEAFVRGMIPHHQGAIDMARIVLEHGSDPENKALAEAIIRAQEAEIAQMRAWLEAKGHAADAPAAAASPDTPVSSDPHAGH
jgi:uncharacterized protein (DUF305 family)